MKSPMPIYRNGEVYCNATLCSHFGCWNHLNTRAYCYLYKKGLAGSVMSGKPVKACADCKKKLLMSAGLDCSGQK